MHRKMLKEDADVRIQELDVFGCLISASVLIKIEQPLIVHPAVLTLIAKLLIFYSRLSAIEKTINTEDKRIYPAPPAVNSPPSFTLLQ